MTKPAYRAAEDMLLRCPILPTCRYPDRPDNDEPLENIKALWSDSALREGIHVASPVLADQVSQLLSDISADPSSETQKYAKKIRRTYRSLMKYAIRMATRTTPFGIFSGCAMVGVGDEPIVVGKLHEHRKNLRVGFAHAKRLKETFELQCDDIRVQLNPTSHLIADRVAIMVNPRGAVKNVNESVSVRHTAAVQHVMEHASTPVPLAQLLATLADVFPHAPNDVLADFITELIERGVLLTEMSASVFDDNPLERLRGVPSAEVDLVALTSAIDTYRATPVGHGIAALQAVYAELRPDSNAGQEQLQVDLTLAARGQVPAGVACRVVQAVQALMRTSLFLAANPELHRHVERFVDVFGESLVPLHRVLDPVRGIGAPAGYPSSRHKVGGWTLSEATETFIRANQRLRSSLIERARRRGTQRVSLEAADLDGLPPALGMWPASYDVFALLDGNDDRVDITIAPVGVSFPAGKAHGRFAHCDDAIRRHLFRMADNEKSKHSDLLLCGIDYINNRVNMNNAAITPSVCDYHLKVTTGDFDDAPKQTIAWTDLLVGVDNGRFHLQHAHDGRQVLCRTYNLVTPEASADVVRFLEEVSYDGFLRPGWTWGDIEHFVDFLPGIEFDGVTLSLPKWRIPRLLGPSDVQAAQLLSWVHDASLPDYVWAGTFDNRLLLHLRDRVHRDLLVREAAGGVEFVSEGKPPQRLGIAHDAAGNRYATEVVFSAIARNVWRAPPPRPLPRYDVDVDRERTLAPGTQWWYFRIYNVPERQNDLLATLVATDDLSRDNWFYIRYRDPDEHLRIRVRAEVDIAQLCSVIRSLVDAGMVRWFSIHTYIREIERYGGLEGMCIAERLFCRESRFVTSNLDLCPSQAVDRNEADHDPDVGNRLARCLRDGAELVNQYLATLCLSNEQAMELLDYAVSGYREEFAIASPTLRRAVQPLVAQRPSEAAERAGETLANLLHTDAYDLVTTLAATNLPWQVQLKTLQSLVHMFANRIGFSRQDEYQIIFLVRSIRWAEAHRKGLVTNV